MVTLYSSWISSNCSWNNSWTIPYNTRSERVNLAIASFWCWVVSKVAPWWMTPWSWWEAEDLGLVVWVSLVLVVVVFILVATTRRRRRRRWRRCEEVPEAEWLDTVQLHVLGTHPVYRINIMHTLRNISAVSPMTAYRCLRSCLALERIKEDVFPVLLLSNAFSSYENWVNIVCIFMGL